MHCSACATRIQRSLNKLPAVASASVNLATHRAFVSYDPSLAGDDDLCAAVTTVGYAAAPVVEDAPTGHRAGPGPLDAPSGDLVATGPGRPGDRPVRSGDGDAELDRAVPGHRRGDRRGLALPPQCGPARPSRRHQHGHPDRAGHAGCPRCFPGRSDRTRGPSRPPGRKRGVRRSSARGDGADHRGDPGDRTCRRGPGARPGRRRSAFAAVPAPPDGPGGPWPGRRRRAGRPRERPGRRAGAGAPRRGTPSGRDRHDRDVVDRRVDADR